MNEAAAGSKNQLRKLIRQVRQNHPDRSERFLEQAKLWQIVAVGNGGGKKNVYEYRHPDIPDVVVSTNSRPIGGIDYCVRLMCERLLLLPDGG